MVLLLVVLVAVVALSIANDTATMMATVTGGIQCLGFAAPGAGRPNPSMLEGSLWGAL